MNKENACALVEWEFARENTIEIIKNLGNEGLNIELPRPGLNTFKKHFQEMMAIEESYINGIKTGKMTFCSNEEKYENLNTVQELLDNMKILDNELKTVMSNTDFNYEIKWEYGEIKTVASHLCALSTHELFHIGQMVAFMYVLNLSIPPFLIENWSLPIQEVSEHEI
ncbi:DinB family protein [Thomasclavelia cocleata]|uniref:DinB family protein n=1 Tax=Thomasclavelia cocleata TaxID=69824 RepID=UPI00272E5A42|nr:DinB family protein [Thomasclavelia cocleata]